MKEDWHQDDRHQGQANVFWFFWNELAIPFTILPFRKFQNFTFTHVHIAFTWAALTIFVGTQNRWAGVTRAWSDKLFYDYCSTMSAHWLTDVFGVHYFLCFSGFFPLLFIRSDRLSFRLNAYMWTNEIYSKNGFMQHVIRRECVCRVKMNANKLGATCFCICPLSTAIVVDGHIRYAPHIIRDSLRYNHNRSSSSSRSQVTISIVWDCCIIQIQQATVKWRANQNRKRAEG